MGRLINSGADVRRDEGRVLKEIEEGKGAMCCSDIFLLLMGIVGSADWETRRLPREQWKEPQGQSCQPVPYGQYKIYRNLLTNEEIEEYGVFLGSGLQSQQYLASFERRLQQEYQVNTRFIDLEITSEFCGCGQYVKVYTQRIPLRLQQLGGLPLKECLYVLHSVLRGFGELFEEYGYFRPTSGMVGIDREARVKVWINADFSSYLKSCPLELERKFHPGGKTPQSEDLIVWETITLFRRQGLAMEPLPFLNIYSSRLTFSKARQLLEGYAAKAGISIKHYLESLLPLIHDAVPSSSAPEESNYDLQDFACQPLHKTDRVVYYIHPMDKSMEVGSSKDLIESEKAMSRCLIPDETSHQPLGQSTTSLTRRGGKVVVVKPPAAIAKKGPRIRFNYQGERVVYNGTHEQYELDPDISEDMLNLIRKQQ